MQLETTQSKQWLLMKLTPQESLEFFPKVTDPMFVCSGHRWIRHINSTGVLRQDIYEWCLDTFGPDIIQNTALDRVYFGSDHLPDLLDPKVIADAYADTVPLNLRRWSTVNENTIAFRSRDEDKAALFKLVWA